MSKFEIAPSLLAADFSRLGEQINALESAGVDVLHLDIMDGHFVPNLTFGPPVVAHLRKCTKLPFDAHLMVENPDPLLEPFAKAGCNWLSVHVETCPHLHRTVSGIRELGMKAGVAINPGTPLSHLDAILPHVDYFLLMSVNPGFGGQSFIAESLERARELKKRAPNVRLQMDGGIKVENVGELARAGMDIAVMGTGLLAQDDYGETVKKIRQEVGR